MTMLNDDGTRRLDVFFYGLYMDPQLLASKGAKPGTPRRASLSGYRLVIGQRATLVPSEGDEVHGTVIALSRRDIEKLYAEPGLDRYRPEAVLARLEDGRPTPALCFTLVETPTPEEHSSQYAADLRIVAEKLGLPAPYIASIW